MVLQLSQHQVDIGLRGKSSFCDLQRKRHAEKQRVQPKIPLGSRGTLSYLVEPLAGMQTEALASLAHGAGRKYDRASMHGRVRVKKSDVARLERNPYGGLVVCGDRGLLAEEAPEAFDAGAPSSRRHGKRTKSAPRRA